MEADSHDIITNLVKLMVVPVGGHWASPSDAAANAGSQPARRRFGHLENVSRGLDTNNPLLGVPFRAARDRDTEVSHGAGRGLIGVNRTRDSAYSRL